MYYSQETNGWYPDEHDHYDYVPKDIVYVEQSDYEQLVQYQVIVKDGKVVKLMDNLTDEQKLQIKKDANLKQAQSEYDIATLKIDALSQQIEDEDGDIKTLESTKNTWTDYRKSLRAYLKTDGTSDLPVSPQAT